MTVVTASLRDVAKIPDDTVWRFATVLRHATDGAIVTAKPVRVTPLDGVISVDLEPGYVVASFMGQSFTIDVPTSGPANLWTLVAIAAGVPPNTPTAQLTEALAQYLTSHPITKASVGLGSADNTPDTAKPVSTAQQAALDLKASIARAATGVAATDVTNLTNALSSASITRAEGGTYLTSKTGVSVPSSKQLTMGKGSKVKLANGELDSGATGLTCVVNVGNGVTFVGEIDGNRGNQSKTAFNAAGGSNAGIYHAGLVASGVPGTPLTGVHIDAKISGVADNPARVTYVNDSYVRIRASDCGGTVYFDSCDNLDVDIEVNASDNLDWKIFPHAVDFSNCSRIRGRVVIRGQKGTGGVTAGTALSNWISGLTLLDCRDFEFSLIDVESADITGQAMGVGVSLVGVRRINVAQTRIVGYSDVVLELCGVTDSTFAGLDLDGRYSVSGDGQSSGRGIVGYAHALRGDFKGRTAEYTRNVKFIGGHVRRFFGFGIGLQSAAETQWFGVKISGNKIGLSSQLLDNDPGEKPARAAGGTLFGHQFFNCEFSYNERSGLEIYDLVDSGFYGCRALNNGQSRTYGSVRTTVNGGLDSAAAGVTLRTSSNKTGLKFDVQADDTQNFTAPGYPDPNRSTVIAVDRVERYGVGQTLTLVGAGAAGADLITRINGITHDELTLSNPVATFPLATLTGTIAVTGTAVVGSGTAFNTDLVGRAFIKVGSEYRRVAKVADDTHATLDSAFSTNAAAGTTLQIVRSTVNGMPSQTFGYAFTADTISPTIVGDKVPAGNVTGTIYDATANATPTRYMLHTSSIHALTAKTTPANADEIPLVDSASPFFAMKKLTWANLKAALASVFGFTSQSFTANGTFTAPVAGIYRISAWGGGGGGGAGGAAAATGGVATQVGGSGAGAGEFVESIVTLAQGDTLAVTVGAGGNGGTGGSASTGATGTAGTAGTGGGFSQVGSLVARGGSTGGSGGANTAVTPSAGAYGQSTNGAQTSLSYIPGCGGTATGTIGSASGRPIGLSGRGGGAGAPASATQGGAAGTGGFINSLTGTLNGGSATNAPANSGQGGDGGGGGAPGGAGGNGANGGSGGALITRIG